MPVAAEQGDPHATVDLGSDGVQAEDITSETFERALRYRTRYDERRGSPISWLIGISRRVIADHLSGEQAHVSEIPELAAGGAFEEQVATRLELRAAVRALPQRDQELVALRYGADLTARQIGEILGLKTNAVEVALHRTLAAIRAELDDVPAGAGRGEAEPAPRAAP